MRLAVFSDIHGNLEALETFMKDSSEQDIDKYFCLGDIVGYGANPNACISRVRSLPGIEFVLGNHDEAARRKGLAYDMTLTATQAILWTRNRLSEENIEFLKTIDLTRKMDDILFSHAAPHNPLKWQYVFSAEDAARVFFRTKEKVLFIGHTHIPQLIIKKSMFKINFEMPEENLEIPIKEYKRLIVNCGSIGQSRDEDPRISYVIYDTSLETIVFRRAAYDYQKASEKILSAGLPDSLASRLAKGH